VQPMPPSSSTLFRSLSRRFQTIQIAIRHHGGGEILFWAICLFMLTTPFTFLLTGNDPTNAVLRNLASMRREESSQTLSYSIRVFVTMATFVGALMNWEMLYRSLPRLWPAIPFVLWAGFSIAWSDTPDATWHSLLALACAILAGFFLAVRLPPYWLARALLLSGVVMGVMSLLWVFFLPVYGVHGAGDASQSVHAGSWRGIYLHKNHLGQICAMYAVAFAMANRTVISPPFLKWLGLALFALLIIASHSASALAIVPIAVFITWLTLALSGIKRALAFFYAAIIVIFSGLAINPALQLLGRDTSLSGRTDIWTIAEEFILRRPWNGYGYMSTTYGDFVFELFQRVNVLDPHNGYLDIVLGTGFIGLAFFALAIGMAWQAGRGIIPVGGGYRYGVLVIGGAIAGWLLAGFSESGVRPLAPVGGIGWACVGMLLGMPRKRTSGRRLSDGVRSSSPTSGRRN
jgi:exopolysaccharide production protein ExoQ